MHVHHVTYDRIGNERFADLVVVCRKCHRDTHAFIDKMVAKGHSRRSVMKKLETRFVRKMLAIHSVYRPEANYGYLA